MATGTSTILEHSQRVWLTTGEVKVLTLIAQGRSSQEAADRMVVSKRTIDFHLANIYRKLDVSNRVQALRAAARLKILPFEPYFGHTQDEL
ncbi:MAG: helix-turn-helix transcriptional regulator [Patescibacteria group bacterium]